LIWINIAAAWLAYKTRSQAISDFCPSRLTESGARVGARMHGWQVLIFLVGFAVLVVAYLRMK
jgi:hypothetical protein